MPEQLPNQCPQCGRTVASYFDHIDTECENWPDEPTGSESVTYRDFEISRHWAAEWQYVHVDYDGDEDNRCGTEKSFELCIRSIDERLAE